MRTDPDVQTRPASTSTRTRSPGVVIVEEDELPYRLTRASSIKEVRPEWFWVENGRKRIPLATLGIAAGREGTGKSSFAIWLAAEVTCGTLPGCCFGAPADVVVFAFEDSWETTIKPRLRAAGADLERVWRVDLLDEKGRPRDPVLPRDADALEKAVRDAGAVLVICDPLLSMFGPGIDTHNEREVRRVLEPLVRIAERTKCVILGIAHFNKGSGRDAASLITGSGAFKNVPRTIFAFATNPDPSGPRRVITQVKNSHATNSLPSLEYDIEPRTLQVDGQADDFGTFVLKGDCAVTVAEVLSSQNDGPERRSKTRTIDDWLDGLLAAHGDVLEANAVREYADGAGYSWDQVKRAKDRLGFESFKGNPNWVWVNPKPREVVLSSDQPRNNART